MSERRRTSSPERYHGSVSVKTTSVSARVFNQVISLSQGRLCGAGTPTTDRLLREELNKKMMSVDLVTKMVSVGGWNRFEMSDSMKFWEHLREHFPVDYAPISCYLDEA